MRQARLTPGAAKVALTREDGHGAGSPVVFRDSVAAPAAERPTGPHLDQGFRRLKSPCEQALPRFAQSANAPPECSLAWKAKVEPTTGTAVAPREAGDRSSTTG